MSVNNSLAGSFPLYGPTSPTPPQPAAPAASGASTGSTAATSSGDDTVKSYSEVSTALAQENLAYLTTLRTAFESGLLANGIIDDDTDKLLFGSGLPDAGSFLGTGSSSSDGGSGSQQVIATRGLSSLAYDVLTGKKTLDSVIHHPASSADATPDAMSDGASDPTSPALDTTA